MMTMFHENQYVGNLELPSQFVAYNIYKHRKDFSIVPVRDEENDLWTAFVASSRGFVMSDTLWQFSGYRYKSQVAAFNAMKQACIMAIEATRVQAN